MFYAYILLLALLLPACAQILRPEIDCSMVTGQGFVLNGGQIMWTTVKCPPPEPDEEEEDTEQDAEHLVL